jgi:hypothetical protein
MCLAQDKKLVVAQRHALRSGGGSGGEPQPFEPGGASVGGVGIRGGETSGSTMLNAPCACTHVHSTCAATNLTPTACKRTP